MVCLRWDGGGARRKCRVTDRLADGSESSFPKFVLLP